MGVAQHPSPLIGPGVQNIDTLTINKLDSTCKTNLVQEIANIERA